MIEPEEITGHIERLNRREIDILTIAAKGRTRKEISVKLSLSPETIKHYASKTLRKLGAANQTNAVAIAYTLGIIRPYKLASQKTERKKITQMGDADSTEAKIK